MNISMNSAMHAMHAAANAIGAKVGANAAPLEPILAPDGAVLPVAAPALPFQHWIAVDGAVAAIEPPPPADEAVPADALEPAADAADESLAADAPVLVTLLAAMTPQPAPAALPAMMMAMPRAKPDATDGAATGTQAPPAGAAPLPAAARVAIDIPALPQPGAPRADAAPASAPAAVPIAAPAAAAFPVAEGEHADAPPTTTGAAVPGAASQPAGSTRGADSVTLAGPPGAWKQSLHEALGERLQLQLGRGLEQATIRLEPPQLGRIEISVRHSGGNLEVHIAASNSEVLRQLNTVSDSLRNDLAGRQYSNVAVSVGETPRAQAAAQGGHQPSGQPGADAGGRGRQQGEDDQRQRTPGLALHDAGDAGSQFSMNERERP